MSWFKSDEEKKYDTRVIIRDRAQGLDLTDVQKKAMADIPDSADAFQTVNLGVLYKSDNPKHFARGLPTKVVGEPRNLDEMDYEGDAPTNGNGNLLGNTRFEH